MDAKLDELSLVPPVNVTDDLLTNRDRAYAYWRGCGLTPMQALRRAGLGVNANRDNRTLILRYESNPKIRSAIQRIFEENRVRYEIDRDRVVEGLLEAINVAREQSDAQNMIAGWRELAKVTGVGAPERKEIVLSQNNPSTEVLRQASDSDLLKLVGKARTLALPVIEDASFVEVRREDTEFVGQTLANDLDEG